MEEVMTKKEALQEELAWTGAEMQNWIADMTHVAQDFKIWNDGLKITIEKQFHDVKDKISHSSLMCKLTIAKDEHATCLKKLEAGKVQQLSDEKFGKALSLLDEQISATKLKLASVAEDDPVTRIQLASQLEAQESMQAVLGVGSSEPANVPMPTAEVEFLVDVVKEKEMQHNLLQEIKHVVRLIKEEQGVLKDIVNLKPAAASVDVPITATKVMIGTEWLENKVQDLIATNAEKEKVEEEEAEGDNVEEEAEQQELADANKDIAEVLEDLSSQGFNSAELDLGDDSPLGHFHKVLAIEDEVLVLILRPPPPVKKKKRKRQKPAVPIEEIVIDRVPPPLQIDLPDLNQCPPPLANDPRFLVRFNQLNLPIAVEDEVLVLILRPSPPVKKKKRKRQKPAVPIEEIVIDRVPPPLQIDLPDLNQCPPPLTNDPRVLILDLNGVLLSHFWPGEEISKHTKRMTEVAYQNGQRVFVRLGAL
ncbi:hypothetical protein L7F22_036193 [Adiantum nelumboides]|nr:hypothetical protein [Adiantum nelumboides]